MAKSRCRVDKTVPLFMESTPIEKQQWQYRQSPQCPPENACLVFRDVSIDPDSTLVCQSGRAKWHHTV